jgi:hypothetical protein
MRVLPNIFGTALGLLLLTGEISVAYAAGIMDPDPIQTTTPDCVRDPNQTEINNGLRILEPAEKGRRAYLRMNCYSCHGNNAHGASMGPSLVGEAAEMDIVYEGDGHGMPAFRDNLCPNDVSNLSAYIQSLGTSNEPNFTHWWEINPSR